MTILKKDIFKRNIGIFRRTRPDFFLSLSKLRFETTINYEEFDGGIPTSVFFREDGRKMYIGDADNGHLYEFDLEKEWEISDKVTFNQKKDLSAQGMGGGLYFKPAGTKVFWTTGFNDYIYQADLTTAWDVSTITNIESNQPSSAKELFGFTFSNDGNYIFICELGDDDDYRITEQNLDNEWDISSWSDMKRTAPSETSRPTNIHMSSNGRKVILMNGEYGEESLLEYELTNQGDYKDNAREIVANCFSDKRKTLEGNWNAQGLFINKQGTKLYHGTAAGNPEKIAQYFFEDTERDME
jgi:hypothetical protein